MQRRHSDSLSGWGRTTLVRGQLVDAGPADIARVVNEAGARGVIARGLGRSYGDAAQNSGGITVRLMGNAGTAVLDSDAATVDVDAATSIDELLRFLVPAGFFVPVSPGTRFVTIGGALASDIHGKNHHVEGSFGNHVQSITMLLADGSVIDCGPHILPDVFWATIGGMGLTGVILRATVRLIRIESSLISVETTRIDDLDGLLAAMQDDDRFRYSVAWIDLAAKGKRLGRSVLSRGDHASAAQVQGSGRADLLTYDPGQRARIPPVIPRRGLLNNLSVSAFNELWFRKAPTHRVDELSSIAAFFHPLDAVGAWNRLYGSRGFVQYQFVVPFGQELALRKVVEQISGSGAASFLAVLKRFGPANQGFISFPQPGWTLALDLPAGAPGLADLVHRLDTLVLDAGGRHYFAKDSHTRPEVIQRGYPHLEQWQTIQRRLDPERRWQSDLARRLGLIESV